jgi:cytochrome P450
VQGVSQVFGGWSDVQSILRARSCLGSGGRLASVEFIGGSLACSDGDEHRLQRRALAPVFAPQRLAEIEATVDDLLTTIVESGSDAAMPGGDGSNSIRFDLVDASEELTLRIAADLVGFSVDADGSRRLRELLRPLAAGVALDWLQGDSEETRARAGEAMDALRTEFVEPAWEDRRSSAGRRVDILGALAGGDRDEWDVGLATRATVAFLAGATGNPARQIVFAVDDLDAWCGDDQQRRDRLDDDAVLRRAIEETNRLHVAGSPILVRRVTEDMVLPSGATISAGELVGVDLVAANRDTDVFGADSDRFDPDRVLPPGIRLHGVAFGTGAHACIGKGLVLGPDGGAPIAGLEFVVLRWLLARRVTRDPQRPSSLADSGQRYYSAFPVTVSNVARMEVSRP